jgi:hypothetical protein
MLPKPMFGYGEGLSNTHDGRHHQSTHRRALRSSPSWRPALRLPTPQQRTRWPLRRPPPQRSLLEPLRGHRARHRFAGIASNGASSGTLRRSGACSRAPFLRLVEYSQLILTTKLTSSSFHAAIQALPLLQRPCGRGSCGSAILGGSRTATGGVYGWRSGSSYRQLPRSQWPCAAVRRRRASLLAGQGAAGAAAQGAARNHRRAQQGQRACMTRS